MRMTAIALACAISFVSTAATAAPNRFSDIIVFGDSLSDVGNAQIGTALVNAANPGLNLPDPTPASVGFFNGRFSNGPIYLDLLHDSLTTSGGPSRPVLAFVTPPFNGGLNFAVGGARAAANDDGIPDLLAQISGAPVDLGPPLRPGFPGYLQYLAQTGTDFDPNALYVVSIGNNDARAIANGRPDAPTPEAAADAIRQALVGLVSGGARKFLIMNVGDLGLSPVFNSTDGSSEAAATDASIAVNAAIDDLVFAGARPATGTYRTGPISFTFFDFFAWSQQIAADPAAFGLSADINLETPCFVAATVDPTVLPGCAGYAWSGAIHPSSSVHAALAASLSPLLQAQLVPAPAALALFGLGVVGVGALRRRTAA